MRNKRNDQKVSFHITITKKLWDKVDLRSDGLAEATGWSEETPDDGRGPNRSTTGEELLEIGLVVIELFGEDWEDSLRVRSEPLWATKGFDKLLNYMKNMSRMTPVQQVEGIEEIKAEIDTSRVLE